MKIIDCYCGLGPWARRNPSTQCYAGEDLISTMDYYGIEKTLVHSNLAVRFGWAAYGNEIILDACARYERLLPAFTLAPQAYQPKCGAECYATTLQHARATWFWPLPDQQNHGMWIWQIGDLLEVCASRRIPVFMRLEASMADQVDRICQSFPHVRLVVVPASPTADTWLYALLHRHKKVLVCLGGTYVPGDGVRRFINTFSADRLVYGSGFPTYSPGATIGHVTYAKIGDRDKEVILYDNAELLVGGVRP